MPAIYRVFSKTLLLNIVTGFLLVCTLQWTIVGLIQIKNEGIGYFLNGNAAGFVCFFILILMDIWLLTSTFLPIIRIDDIGIKAYSLFWTRKIAWTEITHIRLLLVERQTSGKRLVVTFRHTSVAQQKNPFVNKGIRVNTFIVVSNKPIRLSKNMSLSANLLNHRKVTAKDEIAFQYEDTAWQVIQQRKAG